MTLTTEDDVLAAVRLEAAAQSGTILWRNNVGAFQDTRGRWVRFGLANESAAMNAVLKSHDLIGIRRVLVTPEMVGTVIGQFVSREVKHPEWSYRATPREVAQLAFANLVMSYGGDAAFATGVGTL